MTRSELTAWQLGVTLEAEVAEGRPEAKLPARLDWPNLTVDQQEARFRLGDAEFEWWVLRGAADALATRAG